MKKHRQSWNVICQHWQLLTGTTEQRMWPSFRTNNPPCSREMELFFLLSLSYHVTLQLTGPAPSWHPGGSDSPASLWEKGGEREVWEGREEEGMNQNTIKGTEWPFWELKARWLEREWGRGRETEREGERTEGEREWSIKGSKIRHVIKANGLLTLILLEISTRL